MLLPLLTILNKNSTSFGGLGFSNLLFPSSDFPIISSNSFCAPLVEPTLSRILFGIISLLSVGNIFRRGTFEYSGAGPK